MSQKKLNEEQKKIKWRTEDAWFWTRQTLNQKRNKEPMRMKYIWDTTNQILSTEQLTWKTID